MGTKRGRESGVYSITSARRALSEDLHDRSIRYLVSMGIRTACFVGALLVAGPARWVLIAAAVVLPYVAVIVANAGRERPEGHDPATVLPREDAAVVPWDPATEYLR